MYDSCRDGATKIRYQNSAKLSANQIEQLQSQLHQYTPEQVLGEARRQGSAQFWTVPALATWVEQSYGVVYKSATSYRLLKKCGLSQRQPGTQYKSRSEVKVMECEQQLKKTDGHGPRSAWHRDFGRR